MKLFMLVVVFFLKFLGFGVLFVFLLNLFFCIEFLVFSMKFLYYGIILILLVFIVILFL